NFTKNTNSQTWTWERLAANDLFRQAQLQTSLADFVFEQLAHRLDEFEVHFFWQTADVVVGLDHLRGIASDRHALNHIRVQRALREKLVTAVFPMVVSAVLLEQFLRGA